MCTIKLAILGSVVLLLASVAPVRGQTLAVSVLGNERQVGPLEQQLYTTALLEPQLAGSALLHTPRNQRSDTTATAAEPKVLSGFIAIGFFSMFADYLVFRSVGASEDELGNGLLVVAFYPPLKGLVLSSMVHTANGRRGFRGLGRATAILSGYLGVALAADDMEVEYALRGALKMTAVQFGLTALVELVSGSR